MIVTWACRAGAAPLAASILLFAAAGSSAAGKVCAQNETWDDAMSMCMPSPTASAGLVFSSQFNVFAVFSALQGPRGVDQFASANMFMVDAGRSIGARQYINLDLMGTAERWTYPAHGYPALLQIGEERSDGTPYVDAQHPHSSPIMGLTLSDTLALGDKRSIKFYFAPRGESTDGPIAFMHRNSSRDNPDAPLGHHVGQDVGHISSTVLGAQLDLGTWILEASGFNGTEPEPMHVNLPLGPIDSEAFRVTYVIAPDHRVKASIAQVKQTDPTYPGTTSATRLSASIYDHFDFGSLGPVDHAFIVGSIKRHPTGVSLTSFLDEAVLTRGASDYWGRIELLQRLGSELAIPPTSTGNGIDEKRWVSAITLGYTHWMPWSSWLDAGFGTSITMDVIPDAWASAYGHRTPLTARAIIQLRGKIH